MIRNTTVLHFAGVFLLCSLFLLCRPAFCQPASINVHLFSSEKFIRRVLIEAPALVKYGQSEIALNSPFAIETAPPNLILIPKNTASSKGVKFKSCSLSSLSGRPLPLSLGAVRHSSHSYQGEIHIGMGAEATIVISNRIALRDYVIAVVAGEAPPGSPSEMLKAQAVLVQTLMAGRPAGETIDDSTQIQRYAGFCPQRPEISPAVGAVWGKRLCYHNKPIAVYYHSTCAGGTSSAQEFFHLPPGSLPYLIGVPCRHCKNSPFYKETIAKMPALLVDRLYGEAPPVVLSVDAAKRPLQVKIGNKVVSGYDYWIRFGQKLGWDKVPGSRFAIHNSAPAETAISSWGAGHGVGLCQWGAIGLAQEGKNYQQILNYYFPRCTILP